MSNAPSSAPVTNSSSARDFFAKGSYRNILIACGVISITAIIVGAYFLFRGGPLKNEALDQYMKKIPELEQKVQENPQDAVANKDLAYALYVTSNDEKAIQAYNDAIALSPNDPTDYNNLGNLYRKQKSYSKAVEAYNKSIELQPAQINAYVNLANLYIYDLKDYDKGNEVFTNALAQNSSNVDIRIMYAKIYEQHKQNDKAIDMYQEVLRIDPNNATAQQSIQKLGGPAN